MKKVGGGVPGKRFKKKYNVLAVYNVKGVTPHDQVGFVSGMQGWFKIWWSRLLKKSIIVIHYIVAQLVKNPPAKWETQVQSLGWVDPLEKGKAIHSSILAWRIPWTNKSMGLQRAGHEWATFTFTILTEYGRKPHDTLSCHLSLFFMGLSTIPAKNEHCQEVLASSWHLVAMIEMLCKW